MFRCVSQQDMKPDLVDLTRHCFLMEMNGKPVKTLSCLLAKIGWDEMMRGLSASDPSKESEFLTSEDVGLFQDC